jgi:hypothetical protein
MTKKLFLLLIITSFIGFTSCNKDEEPVSLEDSKANVEYLQTSMEDDMSLAMDTEGINALMMFMELMSIDDPMNDDIKKSTVESLDVKDLILNRFLNSGLIAPTPIDISDYYGTYTWDAADEAWDIDQNDPNNKVVFVFPSESVESTTNDATINIYDYTEEYIEYMDGQYSEWAIVPTTIHADLLLDNVKYVEVEADADYNNYAEPTSVNGSIFLKPFTLEASLSVKSSSIDVDFAFKEGSTKIASAGLSLTFVDELYEDVSLAEGYLQYRDIKIAGDIDVATMDSYNEQPTVAQMNENINLALYNYPQGSKFADIVFGLNEDEEMTAYIVYTDGTEVDAMPILEDLMGMLEDLLDDAMPRK